MAASHHGLSQMAVCTVSYRVSFKKPETLPVGLRAEQQTGEHSTAMGWKTQHSQTVHGKFRDFTHIDKKG